jgi:transcriptional regulator GlxA family with amidase domain
MQRIGFVVFPNFQAMGLAVISTFEFANLTKGEEVYEVVVLSEAGGPIRASLGFSVDTEAFGEATFDTVIIGAAAHVEMPTPGLIAFIRSDRIHTAKPAHGASGGRYLRRHIHARGSRGARRPQGNHALAIHT